MSVRREETVRLGWNGQSPKMRERMWSEAIHPEELDQIRSSICVGDKQTWKIDAWEEREGNEHVWKKITVRITGKYRHLVTAIDQNGRSRSRTYVEFAMAEREKRWGT